MIVFWLIMSFFSSGNRGIVRIVFICQSLWRTYFSALSSLFQLSSTKKRDEQVSTWKRFPYSSPQHDELDNLVTFICRFDKYPFKSLQLFFCFRKFFILNFSEIIVWTKFVAAADYQIVNFMVLLENFCSFWFYVVRFFVKLLANYLLLLQLLLMTSITIFQQTNKKHEIGATRRAEYRRYLFI